MLLGRGLQIFFCFFALVRGALLRPDRLVQLLFVSKLNLVYFGLLLLLADLLRMQLRLEVVNLVPQRLVVELAVLNLGSIGNLVRKLGTEVVLEARDVALQVAHLAVKSLCLEFRLFRDAEICHKPFKLLLQIAVGLFSDLDGNSQILHVLQQFKNFLVFVLQLQI